VDERGVIDLADERIRKRIGGCVVYS